jgi:hypothetical protein
LRMYGTTNETAWSGSIDVPVGWLIRPTGGHLFT